MGMLDIYGIGAALVDAEVSVTDDFLARNGINKGVMTLVDEPTQSKLIRTLESNGEVCIRRSGGSVCNSLVIASQLGSPSFFCGKVALDIDGNFFSADLRKAGVKFDPISHVEGVTGKCLVMVTQDAERTMNTFLGVSELLTKQEVNERAVGVSSWLYLEGYLATDQIRTDVALHAISVAKINGVKVALSLSDPFVVELHRRSLKQIIASGVDLIFCNKQEALSFTKSKSIKDAFEKLKGMAAFLVITDGSNGATIFDGKAKFVTKAIKVTAVDTTGAGDMFAGVFLHCINIGVDFKTAAMHANYAASRIVTKYGPRLVQSEVLDLKLKCGL
jgi:sugar/nucleoside kinase (ribokinase family)